MKLVNVLLLLFFILSSFTAMGFSLGEDMKKEIVKSLAVITKKEGAPTLEESFGSTLTGAEFNKLYPGVDGNPGTFLKLMNPDEKHNDYQYFDGECIDTISLCTSDSCQPGGLYFTDILRIQNHYDNDHYDNDHYDNDHYNHFRVITIPDTATVYVDKGKFKADKICLNDKGLSSNQDELVSDITELLNAKLAELSKNGASLSGLDFYSANLKCAVFTGANLTGANLTGANLTGANLTGANLTGAKLWRTRLSGAVLTGTDLTKADLTGAKLLRHKCWRAKFMSDYLKKYLSAKGALNINNCIL